jgi:hypothetical protein
MRKVHRTAYERFGSLSCQPEGEKANKDGAAHNEGE